MALGDKRKNKPIFDRLDEHDSKDEIVERVKQELAPSSGSGTGASPRHGFTHETNGSDPVNHSAIAFDYVDHADFSEVTISAGGAITVTQTCHKVDTNADAASDNLDTINGGVNGMLLVLRPENDARTIVVRHNQGNIWLKHKQDFALDDVRDGLVLMYDGTKWFDLSVDPLNNVLTALKEPTGIPVRTDSDLSFVNGTRTFTIAPSGTSFDYYIAGFKYTVSAADDLIIADTSGVHYIYYDGDTLTEAVNPSHAATDDIWITKAIVCIIYWNATDSSFAILADERHGTNMSGETHHWLHDNIGSKWKSGLTASGYTLNTKSDAALKFDLTDGEFYDEDIEHDIDDGVASNQYEQVLTGDAEIPVLYRDGDPGHWKEQAASTLPYINAGDNQNLQYNSLAGSTWGQTAAGNNKFLTYTLVATNDWQYPIKMVQGNTEYNSKNDALEGAATEMVAWGNMPSPEFVMLFRFIMQTGAYAGIKNAQIIEVTDFRGSSVSGASATSQDHGTLSGLADDDHAQYLLTDGTRVLTGPILLGGNDIKNGGVIFLTEQAAAEADVPGKGQVWIKTVTPNQLWFTNDAGNDIQLTTGAAKTAPIAHASSHRAGGSDVYGTPNLGASDWGVIHDFSHWDGITGDNAATLGFRQLFVTSLGVGVTDSIAFADWYPTPQNFAKDFVWAITLSLQASFTGTESWVKIDTTASSADPGDKSVGFKFDDYAARGFVYGGNGYQETDLSTTLNASQVYILKIVFTAGDKVEWYIDDVLVGTEDTDADLPVTTLINPKLVVSTKSAEGFNGVLVSISRWAYSQEL